MIDIVVKFRRARTRKKRRSDYIENAGQSGLKGTDARPSMNRANHFKPVVWLVAARSNREGWRSPKFPWCWRILESCLRVLLEL